MLKKFKNFQKIICRIYFSDWHSGNILQYSIFCQPTQRQHFTDFIVANLRKIYKFEKMNDTNINACKKSLYS